MRWLFDGNILENESRAAIFRSIKDLDVLLCAGMIACMKEGRLKNTMRRRRWLDENSIYNQFI